MTEETNPISPLALPPHPPKHKHFGEKEEEELSNRQSTLPSPDGLSEGSATSPLFCDPLDNSGGVAVGGKPELNIIASLNMTLFM